MYERHKLIGQKFGKAKILSIRSGSWHSAPKALCLCDCGNTYEARLNNVMRPGGSSCGCLKHRPVSERKRIHGTKPDRRFRARTEYQRNWRKANREKASEAAKRWRKGNADKLRAHRYLRRMVKKRLVAKSSRCEDCGIECNTQGHHADYSKPLTVNWLCPSCHRKRHRK